ncbi:MAG TPA: ATP-binding cassette domain-containing protein [Bacteroides mediterraneensis]|uniref:polyamine ABC transporter ATP-binding protein n=1 Tax=Bacteroides mediterraneensis TaxID=1841856 RepID=UPI0026E99907|nr:ATP-binding cassette domain-containing protein [Bacteroides mediterraneensis]HJH65660.1 ATP-binding cassette domain-containing protein [Bacteroides mediterraneensis]
MQSETKPIIEVKGVSKFFGEKTALDNINLSIKKGEFVTILGPSGCGKTTLLRLIAGFQTASEGVICIAGKEITQTPPHKRPVNTVFQKYALFPHLNVYDNIAFGLKLKKFPKDVVLKKVKAALKMVGMTDYEYRDVNSLSGGQQQRVAIARAIVNEPEVLLLDEPLAALDLKMRKDMQMELKEMHKSLGITFVYVTHDQEEALTLSDTIVVMSEGRIQQIGTPTDIYNEPINSFVADFIGESNILNGVMVKDKLVHFCDRDFECVDEGFGEETPVDVVIRPEDLYIFPVSDMAQLRGVVQSCIFKGVHYEMVVLCQDYEFVVQDYHAFEAGTEVGLLVKPHDIHIMKKERLCNTFDGKLLDEAHVEFLGCTFECAPVDLHQVPLGEVQVEVDFDKINLLDDAEDGTLTGEVKFILYKGNHYHLTVWSDWDENVFVDTNDVWDDGDHVGISIAPEDIRVRVKREER